MKIALKGELGYSEQIRLLNRLNDFMSRPISVWIPHNINNLVKQRDSQMAVLISFITKAFLEARDERIFLFEENGEHLCSIDQETFEYPKEFPEIWVKPRKAQILKFLDRLLKIFDLYKELPEFEDCISKFLHEFFIYNNITQFEKLIIPLPVKYHIGHENCEKVISRYEYLFDYFVPKEQVSWSELRQEHEIFMPNFYWSYYELTYNQIVHLLYNTRNLNVIYEYLEKEINSVKQGTTTLNTDFFQRYCNELNLIKINKRLKIRMQECPAINYPMFITDCHKNLEIEIDDIKYIPEQKHLYDFYESTCENYIDFHFLGECIERDIFAENDTLGKTEYFTINIDGHRLNIENLFAFPPLYEIYVPFGAGNSDGQSFANSKNCDYSIDETALYFNNDYLNDIGIHVNDINLVLQCNAVKNQSRYLNEVSQYMSKANPEKSIVKHFQEFCNTENKVQDLLNQLAVHDKEGYKKIKDNPYLANNHINGRMFIFFLTALSKDNSQNLSKYIKQRMKILLNQVKINKIKNLSSLNEKNLTQNQTWTNFHIWNILTDYKNVLYTQSKARETTLLNRLTCYVGQYIETELSIEEILVQRDKLFSSEWKSPDLENNYKYSHIELDLLYFLLDCSNLTQSIQFSLPGCMMSKIYERDIALRDLYDYVYFDFSKLINCQSGTDIFVNFLIAKIGIKLTAVHIIQDYEKYKDIDFIKRLLKRMIYRNTGKNVKELIKIFEKQNSELYNHVKKWIVEIKKELCVS